jgi:hypothetical protein
MDSSYELFNYLKIKEATMDKNKQPKGVKIIFSDVEGDRIINLDERPHMKVVPMYVFDTHRAPKEVKSIRVSKQ